MSTSAPDLRKGMWLGLLAVTIFAMTLPMTRLAVGGSPQAPLMSGMFIAFGRAVVAGVLSGLLLWATRAPVPARAHWPSLALVALGVVFGFPLFTSIAMRHVEAVHASVSDRTRSGCRTPMIWAMIPPIEAPMTWADPYPAWSSAARASVAMTSMS